LTIHDEIRDDPPDGHSDWFPIKMGEIMKQTKTWCDVISLSPPDGKFLEELRDAITPAVPGLRGRPDKGEREDGGI
jgi:hypothetical protein